MAKNPQAIVTVEVTQFVDVLNSTAGPGNRACSAKIKLKTPIDGVIDQQPPGTGPITVYDVVDIEFDMRGSTGYRLAGIAFRNVSPAFRSRKKKALSKSRKGEKGNGSENMPKDRIFITEDESNGNTSIYITDDFSTFGKPPNQPVWEFYLMVQNSDGTVGLIDPEIQNEN